MNTDAIWSILVHACGAPGNLREDFVRFMAGDHTYTREFRFQGRLGFGGKFYCDHERMWVTCYSEDLTPARKELMRKTNEALAKLARRDPDPQPTASTGAPS